ncbi:hypothetical protein LTR36_003459 [Oleoguttula mirabilis]|uniref:Uncharacterized protein n=1 Tax=Oleoguttula mirabilis TaxID=1507867 RepID=A0AAV9JIN6_9PEZI|nr:hypothetical protein LTR36_003459 [Oleoguttula mirabilis]
MRLPPEPRLHVYGGPLQQPHPIPYHKYTLAQIALKASAIYFGHKTIVVHTRYHKLEYGSLEDLTRYPRSLLKDVRFDPCPEPYHSVESAREAIRDLYAWLVGKDVAVAGRQVLCVAMCKDAMAERRTAKWVSVNAVVPHPEEAKGWPKDTDSSKFDTAPIIHTSTFLLASSKAPPTFNYHHSFYRRRYPSTALRSSSLGASGMDSRKRAAEANHPSSSVAKQARTIQHVKQGLATLSVNGLEEVRCHIQDLEEHHRRSGLDLLNRMLTKLSHQELREARSQILQEQNRRSPLLRLPAELRNAIYDLVSFAEMPQPVSPNKAFGSDEFRFQTVCSSANACRQLRAEARDGTARLMGLGMVVERYMILASGKGWKALDAAETNGMGSVCVLRKAFAKTEDARRYVEPCRRLMFGIVHFTNAVDIPTRMFYCNDT